MQQQLRLILRNLKVTPLAAESFGVRSMCTLVETPSVTILLDAGVSLASYRFNLPPHPIEFQTIARLRRQIAEAADKAQVTTISHYHYDHHTPSFEDWVVNWTEEGETARQIYKNKTVLIKNPKEHINASQRQRAYIFQKTAGKHANTILAADSQTFTYGGTLVRFSEAVAHGPDNSMSGWVVMTTVDCEDERFVFAPDVQGPMSSYTTDLILAEKPLVVMLGGPPLYLGGFRVDESELERGMMNLARIASAVPLVVLEHHVLRGEDWKLKVDWVFQNAQVAGHRILTAAEFAGKENLFLESQRKELYRDHPPRVEFKSWIKTLKNKKIAKPPLT